MIHLHDNQLLITAMSEESWTDNVLPLRFILALV